MDEKEAKEIVDYTFKEVFGRPCPFSLAEVKERFAFDLQLPIKAKDTASGKDTWIMKKVGKNVRVWEEWEEQERKSGGTLEKAPIKSMDDLLDRFNDIFYTVAEKYWISKDFSETDNIYLSDSIYHSSKVIRSQKSAFSIEIVDCKYAVACYFMDNSTAMIRAIESSTCGSSFAVSCSNKVSRSMYISNCKDMYECLFCANLKSKRYCVANMQLTKEEYLPIKEMVVDWTIKNFGKGKTKGF